MYQKCFRSEAYFLSTKLCSAGLVFKLIFKNTQGVNALKYDTFYLWTHCTLTIDIFESFKLIFIDISFQSFEI